MTPRVVAEAGQCMGSSVETAMRMAHLAKTAGAWGFKVQLLKPDTIARADAPKYWVDDLGTATQREAFTKAGLIDYGAWHAVKEACDEYGIEFLATPFDIEAVDALEAIGVTHYKIASGDITYAQLLRYVASTGKHVILSTGASTYGDIDRAMDWLNPMRLTLLACTLSYPTPSDAAHLGRIEKLKRWGVPVGYSDHTSDPLTAFGAAVLGADIIEVHYTYDNDGPDVPDHRMAVNPERLAVYCKSARAGALYRGDPNLAVANEERAARRGARRSLCASRDLPSGHVLTYPDLVALRPGDGWEPYMADELIGRSLPTPLRAGERIPPIG